MAVLNSSEGAERDKVRAKLRYPRGGVERGEDGVRRYLKPPLPTLSNLEVIIGQDPAFYPFVGTNEFTGQVTWDGQPFSDALETGINLQIQGIYDLHVSTERVREVIGFIATKHLYHPVREWLTRLTWDGTPRIDGLLVDYAGAEDSSLNRAIGRRFLLSAVARVMSPGSKVDTTLILVGPQGALKSSLFLALCHDPAWFSDTAMDLHSKDAFQQLQGIWLYEVAELSSLRGRDAESTKAFLTARADRYRPPYGRNLVRWERQCVFVGTTNETEFLDDPTGARRFWPVTVSSIDLAAIRRDRDQLWAEAVEAYRAGEIWYLTAEEGALLVEQQGQHQRADSWLDIVAEWLRGQHDGGVTVGDVLSDALKIEPRDHTKGALMRAGATIAACGWVKRRLPRPSRDWVWRRP